MADRFSHERIDAFTVNGTDWKQPVKAQPRKLSHTRLRPARVHLVDRDEHGFATLAQAHGHFLVQRHNALLHVHY